MRIRLTAQPGMALITALVFALAIVGWVIGAAVTSTFLWLALLAPVLAGVALLWRGIRAEVVVDDDSITKRGLRPSRSVRWAEVDQVTSTVKGFNPGNAVLQLQLHNGERVLLEATASRGPALSPMQHEWLVEFARLRRAAQSAEQ